MQNYQESLERSEERFRALIEHSADAIQLLSAEGKIIYSSNSVERVLGYKPEELEQAGATPYLHPDDLPCFLENFSRLLQMPGGQVTLQYRVKHKNGSWAWIEATGSNYLQEPYIQAIVGNFRNITERKRSEERQHILNQVSEKLASSLDHEITVQEIAQLIVPSMADYCRIGLLDEHQRIKEIVANHYEPEKIELVRELYERYKDRFDSSFGLQTLLRTGQAELIPAVTPEVLAPLIQENDTVLPIVEALGLTSYMGTPLIARDRVVGAITFSSTQPQRHYTHDDLAFAKEVARRIALTLDNARLYREARKAIIIRDDFISIASHELRTPITSLKLYIQMLQKQLLRRGEGQLIHSFAKIDAQLNKLTLLIGDLLNVSRIEVGKLDFQETLFDLNEIVREAVEQIQSITSTHCIQIQGTCDRLVWADKDRIGQVLTNLLTNAIKYSPQAKQVIVYVAMAQDSVSVSVQDFGIGMDREHLNHIFERFYRVSGPEEKTYPGLGIGLYIAYQIVKRHGGTLTVESEKGKGSLFRLTLPNRVGAPLPQNEQE